MKEDVLMSSLAKKGVSPSKKKPAREDQEGLQWRLEHLESQTQKLSGLVRDHAEMSTAWSGSSPKTGTQFASNCCANTMNRSASANTCAPRIRSRVSVCSYLPSRYSRLSPSVFRWHGR